MKQLRLAIILIVVIISGCITPTQLTGILPPGAKVYQVKPFTIVALDEKEISNLATNYFKYDVYGFYLEKERVMYVPFSDQTNVITGNRLPNMYILGHEVLHLKEIEGNYHK